MANDMTVVMRFQAEASALKAELAAVKAGLKDVATVAGTAATPAQGLGDQLTVVGTAGAQGAAVAARGLQETGQGARQATAPVGQLAQQIEDLVLVSASAGKSAQFSAAYFVEAERARAAFAEVEAALSPVARATQQYERAREAVTLAEQAGAVSGERAATVLNQLEVHYDRLLTSARAAENGTAENARAVAEAQRAYSNLVAVIDPVTRAQQEMAAAQEVVNAAVARGVITQAEAGRTLTLLSQRQTEFMGTTGAAAHSVTNLLYQFNDVGLMLASGQNPLMTAIQQGPQISQALGGQGAAGAVKTLGAAFMGLLNPMNLLPMAVIAFGGTAISWLMDVGTEAATVEDQLQSLADAMTRLERAERDVSMPGADLVAKYGEAAGRARELLAIQRQIAETRAQQAFTTASRAASTEVFKGAGGSAAVVLGKSNVAELEALAAAARAAQEEYARLEAEAEAFGEMSTEADQQAWIALQARRQINGAALLETYEYRAAVQSVADAYGISTDAAAQLAVAAAKVREAENQGDRLAAAEQLAKAIYESSDGLRGASEKTKLLYDNLLEAVRAGLDLEALDIASGLDAARGAASGLADELARAVGEARSLAVAGISSLEESRIRLQYHDDPVGEATALFNAQVDAPAGVADKDFRDEIGAARQTYVAATVETEQNRQALLALQRQQSSSNGGGSSGGGRSGAEAVASLSDLRAEVQELLSDLDLQAAQIAEKMRLGLMSSSEGAEALAQARREAAEGVADLIPQMERQNQAAGPEAVAAIEQARAAVKGLAGDWKGAGQSIAMTAKDAAEDLGRGFGDAFAGLLTGAERAEDAFESMGDAVTDIFARMISQQLETRIFTPIFGPMFDSVFGMMGFAKGGVPDAPGLKAHANTIVDRPTPFVTADGQLAEMGEAGPEAIVPLKDGGVRAIMAEGGETTLPLTRSASGHLGVVLPPAGVVPASDMGTQADTPRAGQPDIQQPETRLAQFAREARAVIGGAEEDPNATPRPGRPAMQMGTAANPQADATPAGQPGRDRPESRLAQFVREARAVLGATEEDPLPAPFPGLPAAQMQADADMGDAAAPAGQPGRQQPETRLARFVREVTELRAVLSPPPALAALGDSVVDQPTRFAMAEGNTGEAGEAGAEAILPLIAGKVRAVTPGGETTLPLTRTGSGHLAVLPPMPDILNRPPFAFAQGGIVSQGRALEVGRETGLSHLVASATAGGTAPRFEVNVINNAGQVVEAQKTERGGMGGERIIDVMIEQIEGALSERAAGGRSSFAGTMAQIYGLNRQGR